MLIYLSDASPRRMPCTGPRFRRRMFGARWTVARRGRGALRRESEMMATRSSRRCSAAKSGEEDILLVCGHGPCALLGPTFRWGETSRGQPIHVGEPGMPFHSAFPTVHVSGRRDGCISAQLASITLSLPRCHAHGLHPTSPRGAACRSSPPRCLHPPAMMLTEFHTSAKWHRGRCVQQQAKDDTSHLVLALMPDRQDKVRHQAHGPTRITPQSHADRILRGWIRIYHSERHPKDLRWS